MELSRRLLGAALAVLGLCSAWLALRPEPAPAAMPDPAPVALWAPGRVPALLAEAQGTVELEGAVDGLLGGLSACVVVQEGNRPVLARRPDLPLTPASTQKLLVAAAALSVLGPDFRFETKVVAEHPPRDGVVGTLWLVGSGDPHLATPEYAAFLAERPRTRDRRVTPLAVLADELVTAGVRTVTGGIRGDDSRYDPTRVVPTWKPSYIADNEVGPLSALLVDSGFPIFTLPETRAADPAAHAAGELATLLTARGVAVPDPAGAGAPPEGTVTLATVLSAPFSETVAAMVRESDNTAAELILREVGRRRAAAGSTRAGAAAVVAELASLGLPTDGVRLGDGSGLEVTNTATCAVLAAALRQVKGLRDTLAVAGRSGTLARRLVDTYLEGKLAAKTGSLKGVTGLAGFLDGRRQLSFALLAAGGFSEADGRLLQDRLVAVLADYPGPQPGTEE
ncbi:MAG: D-alanyl-D-alanine carboxypeptidase [Actinomycetota bacterium]|nr:D-alanyl-D-alanine carboxypeptidase [Actinomycetota bacterium]